ncbi:hypothetical protein F2Q69_00046869 [Brassica cretica]|uniref:Uncharacterized protein n=1 Tax=Brassica cretica TaxID=69181 RepID=A0A8S9PRK5_BRACR|nr:hypothetical protein F2Q69_00046869 [Brassica cretica]
MPALPIYSSQDNPAACAVDSSVVTESSGGGSSYATLIPAVQLTSRRNQSALRVMVRSSFTHVTPSMTGTDCPVSTSLK